ncbi:hypothetical protein ACNS7O_13310 [Haloferacaceae archaeon DSL9]
MGPRTYLRDAIPEDATTIQAVARAARRSAYDSLLSPAPLDSLVDG